LDNPKIQHRVLKELPLLGAIEGFSKIRANRRLSAEEVGKGGREGGDEGGLGSYQSILLEGGRAIVGGEEEGLIPSYLFF